eukprot:12411486-Karenia_brevis.AAC.1
MSCGDDPKMCHGNHVQLHVREASEAQVQFSAAQHFPLTAGGSSASGASAAAPAAKAASRSRQ